MSYDEVVASVRKEVQKGLSVEGAVVVLRNAGLTITQSMKALTEVFGMSLADAKNATAGHAVWAEVTKAAEPLHDQLEGLAKEDGDKR
jgi:hypothetical protein